MALITQSVDSRNHVIIAFSVTAGLIASHWHFPLLDTLVGLAVSLLMLKSAIELAIETIRTFDEPEPDLSRYSDNIAGPYQQFRITQLRDWMLYRVSHGDIDSYEGLLNITRQSMGQATSPLLTELGGGQQAPCEDELITSAFDELIDQAWVKESTPLQLKQKAQRRWRHLTRTPRWNKRHAILHG